MADHVFVVGGAFQALNAIEAREHLGLDPEACELVTLVPKGGAVPLSQMDAIVELGKWPVHRQIEPASSSVLNWIRRVVRSQMLVRRYDTIQTLLIGDYRTQIMRSWANRVEAAEVWLLDDGSATLMVNDHRRAALGSSPTPPYPLTLNATRAQNVAARGLGLKLGHPGDVSFFTVYDIEPLATDRVVRNSYRWLKRTLSEPEPVEGSLLLGSPWVEDGKEQIQVLKALQEGLGGIRDVLLDGTQPLYSDIYRRANHPLRRAQGNNVFLALSPRFAMEAFGIAVIAALAYWMFLRDDGIASALPVLGALALGAATPGPGSPAGIQRMGEHLGQPRIPPRRRRDAGAAPSARSVDSSARASTARDGDPLRGGSLPL